MSQIAAGRRINVVVVDDKPDVVDLVALGFGLDSRFEVVGMGFTGADAVRLAEAHRPAALVLDLDMPVMSGQDAIPLIQIHDSEYLLRSYLQSIGRRRPIVTLKLPGAAAAAIRAGANLAPDRAVGKRTWEDFLASSDSQIKMRRVSEGNEPSAGELGPMSGS